MLDLLHATLPPCTGKEDLVLSRTGSNGGGSGEGGGGGFLAFCRTNGWLEPGDGCLTFIRFMRAQGLVEFDALVLGFRPPWILRVDVTAQRLQQQVDLIRAAFGPTLRHVLLRTAPPNPNALKEETDHINTVIHDFATAHAQRAQQRRLRRQRDAVRAASQGESGGGNAGQTGRQGVGVGSAAEIQVRVVPHGEQAVSLIERNSASIGLSPAEVSDVDMDVGGIYQHDLFGRALRGMP